MRRIASTIAAAAVITTLGAGPALAQDCFIVNRSAQGNASATHSGAWMTVTVAQFAHSPDFPPGFDPDCFVSAWLAGGGPASFTVRTNKVIGEGSANPNLANGRGLDHIDEAYGALFGASLASCAR